MVTETSLSSSRPEETRRTPQFCSNQFLDGRESDVLLKPNVAYIAKHLSSTRSTEDLIEAAQHKADKLGFKGVKINSRWSAMAVLAGIK